MIRLPTTDATRFIRALKRMGFVTVNQRGSHLTLRHPISQLQTTVPVHGGDLKRGLMKRILKQIGVTEAELREYI